jgi:hypothetical protein
MVLPILLSAAGGVLGAVLPGMISAIAGAKTEDQARVALEPKREGAIIRLMGQGMTRAAASQQVDEALKGEIEKEMTKGALPPWAEIGLGLLGGVGGGMAGSKIGGMMAKKAAAKTAATDLAAKQANPVTQNLGPTSPFPQVVDDVNLDDVERTLASRAKPPSTYEMESVRTPTRAGRSYDDGLDLMPQEAPGTVRGLSVPNRGYSIDDLAPASGGRGARPAPIREAEYEVVPQRIGMEERGFQTRPSTPDGGISPMADEEAALLEAIRASRATPSAPPRFQRPFPARLGYEEPPYVPASRPSNPLTGTPDAPIGFDPLTGQPIY